MRVAVLGAGGIGLGSAALLADQGHQPVLWSPSLTGDGGVAPGEATIEASGVLAGSFVADIAGTIADAVQGADAALIALPGWAHQAVMEQMARHLRAGQAVIISSHASLGGLYLRRLLDARGVRQVPVIAWGTTAVTGRRTALLDCRITNLRDQVDAAAIPAGGTQAGIELCRTLFGDRFVPREGLLAIQLSNLNPQNHLAMALCNLTRMERGEDWGNYWGITPAVGRLMEALDAERLALAAHFGLRVRTLREHFHLSFQVPLAPVAEQAAMVDARGGAPPGPKSLDTRYLLEDVPYGIAVTERLGALAGIPVPLHAAGVEMVSALLGRDQRAENTLLAALDLDQAVFAELTGDAGTAAEGSGI